MAMTMEQFMQATQQKVQQYVQPFELENERMLEVNLGIPGSNGEMLEFVWIKSGSMAAYRGECSFSREGMLEHGFGNMLKKALTEEGLTLTKASSKSRCQLYLSDSCKRITIFKLQGESIIVNGNDCLAFEPSITHKITAMKKISSIASGGLYNVKLEGHGLVAITSHGTPITLVVGQGMPPVFTDPQATVAWSGDLTPDFKVDIQFKTLFGRDSGESFQMKFDGDKLKKTGFVLVQPYEEKYYTS